MFVDDFCTQLRDETRVCYLVGKRTQGRSCEKIVDATKLGIRESLRKM